MSFTHCAAGVHAPRLWTAAQGQDTLEDTDCPVRGEIYAGLKIQSPLVNMSYSLVGDRVSEFNQPCETLRGRDIVNLCQESAAFFFFCLFFFCFFFSAS